MMRTILASALLCFFYQQSRAQSSAIRMVPKDSIAWDTTKIFFPVIGKNKEKPTTDLFYETLYGKEEFAVDNDVQGIGGELQLFSSIYSFNVGGVKTRVGLLLDSDNIDMMDSTNYSINSILSGTGNIGIYFEYPLFYANSDWFTAYINNDFGMGIYPEGYRGNNISSGLFTNKMNFSVLFKSNDQKNGFGIALQLSPFYSINGFGFDGTQLQESFHFYAQADFRLVLDERVAFTFSLPLTSTNFQTNDLSLDSNQPLFGIQFNPGF